MTLGHEYQEVRIMGDTSKCVSSVVRTHEGHCRKRGAHMTEMQ